MSVLDSSVSEWVLCLAVNMLTMTLLISPACKWLPFLDAFLPMPTILAPQQVSVLLCLKPADDICFWFSRKWVVVVSCNFNPADACWWLSRKWVYVMSCCILSNILMPTLDSPACGWLPSLTMFQAYWQCLSLVYQLVSGYYPWLHLEHTHNDCLQLSS